MLDDREKIQRIIETARMYYLDNMTQNEIAKNLNISRPLVSKILSDAKELGIVTIQIKSPFNDKESVMKKMQEIYNLQGGLIVEQLSTTALTDQNIFKETIGFLQKNLSDVKVLGLGWGNMIGPFIDKIESEEKFLSLKGKVVPLIGNTNMSAREYHPNDLIRVFGEKTNLTPAYLFAPAFLTTEQEKEIFMNIENYKEISKMWEKIDTAFIGINSHPSVPDLATALRFGNALNEKKAVGKILSYYFDKDGNIIEGENDFSIQISWENLKKIKKVIGIASSKTNKKAIIGALKTGIFTHIILSEKSAEEIIE